MGLFELAATFDPKGRKVRLESNGTRVELTLDRDIKAVQYVGYCVKHAVTAFSPVEITPR